MINNVAIQKRYNELCATPSDINELLPHLYQYALRCRHITEMGVRVPTSTYAFLAAEPVNLIGYDIRRYEEVSDVELLAPDIFSFILQDVLKADIDPTDFLFIDTYHTATQLKLELARHEGKVSKYIGLHDTASFWEYGETPYAGLDTGLASEQGLKYALYPFLKKGGWLIAFATDDSNGLIILERKSKMLFAAGKWLRHYKYLFYLKSRRNRQRLARILQIINGEK